MTINEYLNRKNARENTLFRIKPDGTRVFILNDQTEVPEKDFLEQNKLPVSLVTHVKPNPDKRYQWMNA